MIDLSITRSSNTDSATRSAHRLGFLSSAFTKTRVAQAGVLVVLFSVIFSQTPYQSLTSGLRKRLTQMKGKSRLRKGSAWLASGRGRR